MAVARIYRNEYVCRLIPSPAYQYVCQTINGYTIRRPVWTLK